MDSVDLLDYAILTIIAEGVHFVLICGDLTKDGELISHRLLADRLKAFTDKGIAVYVVPGNHDINNFSAVSLAEGVRTPVPTVSPEEFLQIYKDFGFSAALMRDDNSLSYVAEPVEGLWLLAIDSCLYREHTPENVQLSSGRISKETKNWIAGVLKAARNRNKAVMVMMHHGIVEHWKGQAKFHGNYLVKNYEEFGKFLASWDVRIAFTGHYHSQDITLGKFESKFLFDIETGSLLAPPCPIRFAEIKDNAIQIRSETIADTVYPKTNFAQNAENFMKVLIKAEIIKILSRYKITGNDAELIADVAVQAAYAHFTGDENPALRQSLDKSQLELRNRFLYFLLKNNIINNLWKDIPPSDNNVQFGL